MTTAILFPGQGSQRVGMGAALLAARPDLFALVDRAGEAAGLPLRELCLEGPPEALTRTEVVQPALFALSLAVFALAREAGVTATCMAGHSLGECTAAVASGALALDDGLHLVAERGRLMAEAHAARPGGMVAVVGLPVEQLRTLCERASGAGVVGIANHNSPRQTVVSGDGAAVDAVAELAREAGAKRVVPLADGGAFHTEVMEPARQGLAELMGRLPWRDPETPLVANVSARFATTGDGVRDAVLAQTTEPVRWAESVQTMIGSGCRVFLELGPGSLLGRLVRQTDPQVEVFAADSPEALDAFLDRQDGSATKR